MKILMTIACIASIVFPLVMPTPALASDQCSYLTKYNLNMALGFLKDYAAYENEGGDVNNDLAAAALNNLRHELDITDWNDVFECGHRAVSFYQALDVHASLAEGRAAAKTAASDDNKSDAKLDLSTVQMKISDAMGSLSVAYGYGYATYNLPDYKWLKQEVKAMAAEYHVQYKSPERGGRAQPYAGPPNQWP